MFFVTSFPDATGRETFAVTQPDRNWRGRPVAHYVVNKLKFDEARSLVWALNNPTALTALLDKVRDFQSTTLEPLNLRLPLTLEKETPNDV